MQKLILTILIISNIAVGLEVASDYEDAWAEIGFSANAGQLSSDSLDNEDPMDEVPCDHCCHASAHLAGLTIPSLDLPYFASDSYTAFSAIRYIVSAAAPPTPPPNA